MSTRAQTWYIDFTIGIFIFMVCLILFYRFVPNIEKQDVDSIKETYAEAKILSDTLMSEGSPSNWTMNDLKRVGLLTGKSINSSKLIEFANMTADDYYISKETFNIKSDFIVFFTEPSGGLTNISNISLIGHQAVTLSGTSPDLSNLVYSDLVTVTRIVKSERRIIKMVIFVWQ